MPTTAAEWAELELTLREMDADVFASWEDHETGEL